MNPVGGAGPATIMLIGLVLGMRHATDPDHVIAVTTIVSQERRIVRAAMIGAVWGIGHTLTVLLVGGAIIAFKVTVPIRIASSMEFAVAIVLMALGIAVLRDAVKGRAQASDAIVHSHPHRHGALTHSHPHAHHDHEHSSIDSHAHLIGAGWRGRSRMALWRSLGVGVVHGLAGSAAIAILVLSAIPNPAWAIAYLVIFGIGTVAGMVGITTAIGLPISFTASRLAALNRALAAGAGLLSLAFGIFMALELA